MNELKKLFNREPRACELHEKYQALKRESSWRRREIAGVLKVSEAALLDAQCEIKTVRLKPSFTEIIKQLPTLDYLMSLTRNESAVHERKGVYDNVSISGSMGLVIADDRKIDLRIFVNRWKHGFAVCEELEKSPRYSLQFFDQSGTAIQKIFMQDSSNMKAYIALVEQFLADDQITPLAFEVVENASDYADDEAVDVEALTEGWLGMTDVHQFFGLLKKHRVSREQAFRLVGGIYAQPLDPGCVETLLTDAAEQAVPIMCFVGSYGQIQIHSGVVKNIKRMGPWINVLDPEFNLHLMDGNVASAWLVRKPGDMGLVTSIELYDANSEIIAQFYGVRREGEEENPHWRELAESLLIEEQAVA